MMMMTTTLLLLGLLIRITTTSAWLLLQPPLRPPYLTTAPPPRRRCRSTSWVKQTPALSTDDGDDGGMINWEDISLDNDGVLSPPPLRIQHLFLSDACRDDLPVVWDTIESITGMTNGNHTSIVPLDLARLPAGVTGRVALLHVTAPVNDDVADAYIEEWTAEIRAALDTLAWPGQEEQCLRQPILFAMERTKNDEGSQSNATNVLQQMIQDHIRDYALVEGVEMYHHPPVDDTDDEIRTSRRFQPTLRYEVDGAWVDDEGESIWDTSSILVFDDIVSCDLRERLLTLLEGPDWNATATGRPHPDRWHRGGLVDLPTQQDDDDASYGLTDTALAALCATDPVPMAMQALEESLVALWRQFRVTRLPTAVLGDTVTPLTANAPCAGQTCFAPHIDADPYLAPPSPWTDIFGRYANRSRGKPRFVSCLIYLNDPWDADAWGVAPTRCWDVATDTRVEIHPRPGRVVLMDQDITHSVVAGVAGPPRYSLVWKLVLHPRVHEQDMRVLLDSGNGVAWCDPILVGSANRSDEEEATTE